MRYPGGEFVEILKFSDALAETAIHLADPNVDAIFEAAFLFDDVRIRVDVLQRDPTQKIIVLTIHNEQTFTKRMLEIGARGYLTKECGVDEMLLAIRQVYDGSAYIAPSIAQQLALSLLPGNQHNPIDRLSRREFQVMLMISNGLTNAAISEKLCLSPKTVSTYRLRLLEKLGAQNEVDLVKIAVEQGMVEFSSSA